MCYSVPCCSTLEDSHCSIWALLTSMESGQAHIPNTVPCIICFLPGQRRDNSVRSVSNTSGQDIVSNVEDDSVK